MPRNSSTHEAQEDVGALPEDEKRELVQRIINSQIFRRSSALRAFLVYITEQEISGQADKLKEHTIGVEVLGRRPDYVPMSDNIVRVRAHELRGRLERYFASEGANESIAISIPVGSYAPKFTARKAPVPEPPSPEPVTEPTSPRNQGAIPWRRNGLPIAVIVLLALSIPITLIAYALKSHEHPRAGAMQDFWGQFFDSPNEELKVVYADPGYASWQDLSNKTLNLGDYLSHKYLNPGDDALLKASVRRTASLADIEVVGHLGTIAGQFGGQINVQFARDISTKFFQRGNLILLGSRRSDPWVELYEPSLNFTLEVDPHSGVPRFRNRVPRPGEAASYSIPATSNGAEGDDKQYVAYGLAALLKGCGRRGLTVVAEGLSTQSTEAVGDMITDPEHLNILLKSIGHKPGTKVAPFEALIQITSFANTQYDDPKVIAYRLQPAGSCVGD